MAEAFRNLEEVIRTHGWFNDQELARVEQAASDGDVERLLKEYRLCRALLREALGQRTRILDWSETAAKKGGREESGGN